MAFHNAAEGGYHLHTVQYHAALPLSCAERHVSPCPSALMVVVYRLRLLGSAHSLAALLATPNRLLTVLKWLPRVSRKNSGGMLRVLPPHPLGVCKYAFCASAARLAYLALFS